DFACSAKSTVLPCGTTPKIKDFRTFLEIQSFALAGKPTDANLVYYNICDVAFACSAKSTVLPCGTTPKIKDFRTFLEIQSFALAGKPTDANFVYYNCNTRKGKSQPTNSRV
ncbi:MAG: hypothetical protein IJ488_06125, partial [Clostridia bacterium]|nr:hypothetical protein [Clostridia bacterium]